MLPTLVASIGLSLAGTTARAAPVPVVTLPQAGPAAPDAMDAARRYTARRTRADCIAEAVTSPDIIVCAPRDDQPLPVPEVYGPVPGSTDGAAVQPTIPCELEQAGCFSGVNLPKVAGAVIGIVGLILDPDRDLGEGAAIPERFRGANR
jgi:hypothetical protein